MVSPTVKSGLCMGCGSFSVVLGAIMVIFWPPIYISQLQRMLTLSPTSMSFDIWRETPLPMYLECFMFNISNVDDILSWSGDVPLRLRVDQLGPYVFRETHTKTNLTWHNNSTIQFYNQRYWHFMPDMSNGSLSDEIVSINPVIATVAYERRRGSIFTNLFVDMFLRRFHSNMFLSANASAWLFDGIDDPVIDIALEYGFNIPYDKFGWFYERNGSIEFDGAFLMNTGAEDFSQIGNIEKWKYSDRTIYRDQCGEVRGSTGELWAPETGQPNVTIFASDICTYMILPKDKDVEILGIQGVQYAANDSLFDNGHNYPHMACYCDEVRNDDCMPSGALNVSACRFGAPAFVSLPHFLNSDPHYPAKIDGLSPTEEMRFRLSLEMFTGIPLAVAAQLQINLLVRHVVGIPINNALPDPDTLVPMFWFRQEVRITPEYASMARTALRLRYWTPYAFYAVTVIGVILLMVGVTSLVKKLLKSPEASLITEGASQDS